MKYERNKREEEARVSDTNIASCSKKTRNNVGRAECLNYATLCPYARKIQQAQHGGRETAKGGYSLALGVPQPTRFWRDTSFRV